MPPGRKKLPPELKRQKLCIALTPVEQSQLQALAEDADLTTSQVIAALIARAHRIWVDTGKNTSSHRLY